MPSAKRLIDAEQEGPEEFEGGEVEAQPGPEEEAWDPEDGRDEGGRYHCPECECNYGRRCELYRHLREEHETFWNRYKEQQAKVKESYQYECEVCQRRFEKPKDLRNHRDRNHTKEELADARPKYDTHICEICGKGHREADHLRKHLARCKKKQMEKAPEAKDAEPGNEILIMKDAVEEKPDLKSVLQRAFAGAKARKTARLENSALAMKIKAAAEKEKQELKKKADNQR